MTTPPFSFAGGSWGGALALLGAGWALLACGLGFWARRPRNPVGPLFITASAAWFIAEWDSPRVGSGLVFTIGLVLFAAGPPLVAWAMLAYPTGRLDTSLERVVIITAVAGHVLVIGLLPALFFDPIAGRCTGCPENLALIAGDAGLVGTFDRVGMRFGMLSSVALIAVAVWRFVRASGTRRRLTAPVVVAGTVYLGLVGWTFATGVARGFVGTGALERRLWFAQALILVALAAAIGWGRCPSTPDAVLAGPPGRGTG